MVEFSITFQGSGIKIYRVISILVAKQCDFLQYLTRRSSLSDVIMSYIPCIWWCPCNVVDCLLRVPVLCGRLRVPV